MDPKLKTEVEELIRVTLPAEKVPYARMYIQEETADTSRFVLAIDLQRVCGCRIYKQTASSRRMLASANIKHFFLCGYSEQQAIKSATREEALAWL